MAFGRGTTWGNPILRGRKQWPCLLSTCEFWDDPSKQQSQLDVRRRWCSRGGLREDLGEFSIWKESSTCTWFWFRVPSIGKPMLFFCKKLLVVTPILPRVAVLETSQLFVGGWSPCCFGAPQIVLGVWLTFPKPHENLGYMKTENQYEEIDILMRECQSLSQGRLIHHNLRIFIYNLNYFDFNSI